MPQTQFIRETEETMGVPSYFWEYVIPEYGSIQNEQSPDFERLTIRYRVPWTQADFFAAMLKGYPFADPDTGELRRHLPEPWRGKVNEDGQFFLWCTHTKITPFGGKGTTDFDDNYDGRPFREYQYAWVEATFETLIYPVAFWVDIFSKGEPYSGNVEAYRYFFWTVSDSVNAQTIESGRWVVDVPGLPDNKLPDAGNKEMIPIPESMVEFIWFDVSPECFNEARARTLQGKGNESAFLWAAAETLILESIEPLPKKGANGMQTLQVKFRMRYKPNGINKVYFKGGTINGYYYLRDKTDSTIHPIKLADFTLLLKRS